MHNWLGVAFIYFSWGPLLDSGPTSSHVISCTTEHATRMRLHLISHHAHLFHPLLSSSVLRVHCEPQTDWPQ